MTPASSFQFRFIALLFLIFSIYILFIQYELNLSYHFIPELPTDYYLSNLILTHYLWPQLLFLLSIMLTVLSKPALSKTKVKKPTWLSMILIMPTIILFMYSDHLMKCIYKFSDPVCIFCIGYFGLRLRLPEIFTDNDNFGIKNPESWFENEISFNWKTSTGYINVLNPFQGILIVGAAGSGKTYSLIEEIIRQSLKKGYTGFIYDYKYPDLSNYVYTCINSIKRPDLFYYHINFSDITRTHRINPLHPDNLPVSAFAAEYAGVILKNLKKEWVIHADFWADNAIAYLKAIIWYLKKHKPEFCTLPHVICLCLYDYSLVLNLLAHDQECKAMISSLLTAFYENAGTQVAGCISSLQTPIDKLNNPHIFWVFSGNDCDLELNNPNHPAILTIGNNPQLSATISPVISLVASVIMNKMNQKNKLKSIFLLDEAPTLYIPDLKNLPNTGRGNKICTVYCCQDFSQMNVLYGADESRALRASLANQFIGLVNDTETAEQTSKMFGQMERKIKVINVSSGVTEKNHKNYSSGYSIQHQQKNLVEINEIMTLETGIFIGKTTEAKNAFFKGRPILEPKPACLEIPVFKKLDIDKVLLAGTDLKITGNDPVFQTSNVHDIKTESQQTEKLLAMNFQKIKNESEELIFGRYSKT